LRELAVPQNHLPLALLTFNTGVELSQLFAVGVAWGLTWWLSRYEWFGKARKPALYLIGATATFWFLLRTAAIAG